MRIFSPSRGGGISGAGIRKRSRSTSTSYGDDEHGDGDVSRDDVSTGGRDAPRRVCDEDIDNKDDDDNDDGCVAQYAAIAIAIAIPLSLPRRDDDITAETRLRSHHFVGGGDVTCVCG